MVDLKTFELLGCCSVDRWHLLQFATNFRAIFKAVREIKDERKFKFEVSSLSVSSTLWATPAFKTFTDQRDF